MFCENCGKNLNDDEKICLGCGKKVEIEDNIGYLAGRRMERRVEKNKIALMNWKKWLALATIFTLFSFILLDSLVLKGNLKQSVESTMQDGVENISTDIDKDKENKAGITLAKEKIETTEAKTTESETTEAKTQVAQKTGYEFLYDKAMQIGDAHNLSLITTDVSEYPKVKLYCSMTNALGESVNLQSLEAGLKERISGGEEIERTVKRVERLQGNEGVGFEILVDKSGSMEEQMASMQNIMHQFIAGLDYNAGDHAEILSFDSYIMYMCNYTNNVNHLLNGISNMTPYGGTALYDALFTGITNAGSRQGANCVIAFTDGMDNESTHTYQEVVVLANQKEIPVYLIGMGEINEDILVSIANNTGGNYWNISTINDMGEVLGQIYRVQKDMYCIEYESSKEVDPFIQRDISMILSGDQGMAYAENMSFIPTQKQTLSKPTTRYEIIAEDISWIDANTKCIEKGGRLATITSQAEMDTLVSMAEASGLKYLWIGGYTSVRGDVVFGHWTTGESFDYAMWYPGEPSRSDVDGTPEFYLMLWNVEGVWSWNDQRNDVINSGLSYFRGKTGYICEYEGL